MLTIVLLALFVPAPCEGGNEVRVGTANDIIYFYNKVNAGTTYEGTTVFLESDIDFDGYSSSYFSIAMGKEKSNHFKGTFDGQGHVFRNTITKYDPNYQYAGMFGYSSGMTVRNVVIDSSCTAGPTRSFSRDTCIGGIMGQCISNERLCIIENVVNMADIPFDHEITANLFLGGIAGHLSVSIHEVVVRNCANYGKVSLTKSAEQLCIGGIAGYSSGISTRPVYIQNCLNYGELAQSGNVNSGVSIGGIVGESSYITIENCVSAGKISPPSSSGSFGSIVGNPSSSTSAIHSFWTKDTGCDAAYGSEYSSPTDSYLITPSFEAVNNLNEYEFITGGSKWSKWLLNANNKTVTFHINNTSTKPISINSQIILLPSTTVDNNHGFYWYTDAGKSKLLETVAISKETTLYGGVTKSFYMVTFDLRGGESASGSGSSSNITIPVTYASPYGELPEVTKTGHTFSGWFTDIDGRGSEVTSETTVTIASDHTLYACWTINSYIVTFDFGNGTTTNKSFQYNSQIQYPAVSEREGYTFNGWSPNPDTMPSHDLVITANWTINRYIVTFDFGDETTTDNSFEFNSQIQYPIVSEREGYTFNGWSPNPDTMPSHDLVITANWTINRYTVTFDFGNGTTTDASFEYNSSIVYLEDISEREGYIFNGWTPKPVTMPSHDLTITANWTINRYTVTFDFGNGTTTDASFVFNSPIDYPAVSEREGYIFNGWTPNPDTMPSHDIVITANWTEINSTELVEIVFGTKDLKEEDVEMIIAKYTSDSFTISKFEISEETGEIRVIVKFTDKGNAESFVEKINSSSEMEIINRASFIYDVGSFSPMTYPILFMFAYLFAF